MEMQEWENYDRFNYMWRHKPCGECMHEDWMEKHEYKKKP